jgi:hypothetical protein
MRSAITPPSFAILAISLLMHLSAAAQQQAPGAESVEVLVDRLLALPGYVPDPRVRADDQRTPLLQAIAARGEAGATVMVARLLAMPSSQEDPQGANNAFHWQLIRDIGFLGDAAIEPMQKALGQARTTDQRREMVQALGVIQTPASTRVMLPLLADQDDTIRQTAISSLSDRLGTSAERGGTDDLLPAFAKALAVEKDEFWRTFICARVVRARQPISPADQPDARLSAQATDLLRERLKNDPSPVTRFWAACSLTEFGDNSGLVELEKGALTMQAQNVLARETSAEGMTRDYSLDRLVPALERATGQKFGPVPLNPEIASDLHAIPRLATQRQELLDKIVAWVRANPATTDLGPGGGK